jgi:hypothetical protein
VGKQIVDPQICGLVEVLSPQESLRPQIADSQITNPLITKQDWVRKSQI